MTLLSGLGVHRFFHVATHFPSAIICKPFNWPGRTRARTMELWGLRRANLETLKIRQLPKNSVWIKLSISIRCTDYAQYCGITTRLHRRLFGIFSQRLRVRATDSCASTVGGLWWLSSEDERCLQTENPEVRSAQCRGFFYSFDVRQVDQDWWGFINYLDIIALPPYTPSVSFLM